MRDQTALCEFSSAVQLGRRASSAIVLRSMCFSTRLTASLRDSGGGPGGGNCLATRLGNALAIAATTSAALMTITVSTLLPVYAIAVTTRSPRTRAILLAMSRSSTLLLAVAGTGVLATIGLLAHAVQSEPEAPATSTPPGAHTESPPIASRTPSTTTSSNTAVQAIRRAQQHAASASTESDAPAPVLDDHAPPATRGNTKNLHFGGTQLRAQTAAVRPLVEKCIADAAAKGIAPTGTASLTYIVAQHGDKVSVEDTGIDESNTTLQAPELVDCMRETARAMKFEGLPREAEGIVATRSVTLEAGKLVDYKHVTFSYLR